MATLRLSNGSDVGVKLSIEEVKAALGTGSEYIELPGDDGPIYVRPEAVIAIIEDSKRGTAGFRIGAGSASS